MTFEANVGSNQCRCKTSHIATTVLDGGFIVFCIPSFFGQFATVIHSFTSKFEVEYQVSSIGMKSSLSLWFASG